MSRPIRIPSLTEKDKEELKNAFAGKPRKFDKIPDISTMGDGEFGLANDGTNDYIVVRKGKKLYKVTMTEVT